MTNTDHKSLQPSSCPASEKLQHRIAESLNSEPDDGKFTYQRGTDGCDETWDICYPDGSFLVSIHFWEKADETEAEARMIVDALNAYQGRKP